MGPYVVVEMLLPEGTMLALLLFLYRRRRLGVERGVPLTAVALVPVGEWRIPAASRW